MANKPITSGELEYILEVNKKAIEINVEVAQQQEQVLEKLKLIEDGKVQVLKFSEETNEIVKESIEEKIESIEKHLFRLNIILGSAGVGAILTLIQYFIHK